MATSTPAAPVPQTDSSPVIIGKTDHPVHFSLTQFERRPSALRDTTAPSITPTLVDLRGWDTLFAIRLPDLNLGIAKYAAANPSNVPSTYTQSKNYTNVNYTATGSLANWRVIPGGDGTVLRMAIDLPTGSLTRSTPQQTFSYQTGVLSFSLNLSFVPRTGEGTGPVRNDLVAGNTVFNVAVDFPVNSSVDPIVSTLLRDMMTDWLMTNLRSFQFIFASVNLNTTADNGDWQWLAPTSTAYAYKQPGLYPLDNDCIFGVLCGVQNHDTTSLSAAIDSSAIPPEGRAGFVLGAPSYYNNVLTKHLAEGFDNGSSSDFEVLNNADGTYSVTNINTVNMTCDGKKFEIERHNFVISMGAGNITTSITSAKHTVSAGIDLYLNYKIKTACELQNRSDGSQALMLVDDGEIETSHTVQKAPWVTITEIIAGAIAGAILAGIGEIGGEAVTKALANAGKITADSLTARVIKVIISTLIGILSFGIIINISNLIAATADKDANSLPPFNPFATEAVKNTVWPNAGTAQFTGVVFNNGLQIALDPKFVE